MKKRRVFLESTIKNLIKDLRWEIAYNKRGIKENYRNENYGETARLNATNCALDYVICFLEEMVAVDGILVPEVALKFKKKERDGEEAN